MVAALLAAGCDSEATGPTAAAGGVLWVEWPTTVSPMQPGAIRVSVAPQCPQYTDAGVSVTGSRLDVTATVDFTRTCISRGDILILLPPVRLQPSTTTDTITIWAPVLDFSYVGPFTTNERFLGSLEVSGTPDTATLFAGLILVFRDSVGCWRGIPSSSSRPTWTFAKSPPLGPESSGHLAFIRGRLVPVTPPVCGDTLAIDAFALEIDATPH